MKWGLIIILLGISNGATNKSERETRKFDGQIMPYNGIEEILNHERMITRDDDCMD